MSKTNAYVQDGDVGCGTPGSLSWHKCAVAEMSDEETARYVFEVLPDMLAGDAYEFLLHLIKGKTDYGDGN